MKVLNRVFLGNVLIFIGVVVFLFVIYDTIRPYFPNQGESSIANRVGEWAKTARGALFPHRAAPEKKAPEGAAPPPPGQPPVPPPLGGGVLTDKMFTNGVINVAGSQQLWVWRIKPGTKTGKKVRLEIAHPEPGEKGGFWMIAYADTNDDGKPDREIAKSEYFTAEKAGDWSVWEFETDENRLFVGDTWPADKTVTLYRGNGEWPDRQSFLEGRFYYSVSPTSPDATLSAGPAYTNMIVSFP